MQAEILKMLIAAIPLPVMVIGSGLSVVAINPPLQALLGSHLEGRHFITALRQPLLVEAVERALADRAPGRGQFLGRDGNRDTTFDVAINPYEDGVVLSFEDRTAAQEVGQLRRDFVANVSHELRTPLTALFGFIETLRGPARNDPAARDRFLAIMEREATRMIRLVDDLLSLSRVEEDERVRPIERIVLADLIRTAIAEMAPVISAAGGSVAFRDDSGNCSLPADQRQIRQVICNLIENALKYGAKGEPVEVALTAPRYAAKLRTDAVQMIVSDRGQGIAAHHIPRLTERFYRVDDHRSREVGGTGLGLAIVKHIISRHRGRLEIASEQGKGTIVTVTLPV